MDTSISTGWPVNPQNYVRLQRNKDKEYVKNRNIQYSKNKVWSGPFPKCHSSLSLLIYSPSTLTQIYNGNIFHNLAPISPSELSAITCINSWKSPKTALFGYSLSFYLHAILTSQLLLLSEVRKSDCSSKLSEQDLKQLPYTKLIHKLLEQGFSYI